VGAVLLLARRRPSELAGAGEKPAGLTIVAALTLLASFGLALLWWVLFFLNFVGMAFASSGVGLTITLGNVYVFFPALFALFSFAASILLLAGIHSTYLWYAMVMFWVLLFAFCAWWGYTFIWQSLGPVFSPQSQIFGWMIAIALIPLAPLTYSVGCLLYFQKRKVKNYFHV
jgi:hypothetical protein